MSAMSDESPVCSARGCRSAPAWALEWSNPRIHGTDRRKTWLACEAHRESLADFLTRRGFLRATLPFAAPPAGQPSGSDDLAAEDSPS